MLKSIQGFELKTREAIDNRLVLSKLEMLNINDNQMPEKYFAICTDDGYLYIYNKNASLISSETGKFKKYSYCKIESITINGTELPIEDLTVDIPLATHEAFGVSMAGKGIKATSGVYSVDFNAIDDGSIPIEKVQWENAIVVRGYLYNGEFYQDEDHRIKYVPYEYKIYVDITSSTIFIYNGENYISAIANVPFASDTLPGILKLYQNTGTNTDGSISQKIVTDELNQRFKINANVAEETIIFSNK
jgi:hypothetical protein